MGSITINKNHEKIRGLSLLKTSKRTSIRFTGELARVYPADELVGVMLNYQAIYTLGFVVGPALNVLFLRININIGTWHLDEYNFIGIFLASLLIIYTVIAYWLLHDLSSKQEEIPLRHENEGNSATSQNEEEVTELGGIAICIRGGILTSFPIMLLILSSSLNNFVSVLTEITIPILSNKLFAWSVGRLAVVTTICVTILAVTMIGAGFASLVSSDRVYPLYLSCFGGLCFSVSLLVLPSYTVIASTSAQIALVVCVTLVNSCCGLMSVALAKWMYLTLVPPESASMYEGVRGVVYRVFGLTAFLTTSFIFPHLHVVGPILLLLLVICSLLFCVRRNRFNGYSQIGR